MRLTKEQMVKMLDNYDLVAVLFEKTELFMTKDRKDIFKHENRLTEIDRFLEKIQMYPNTKWKWVMYDELPKEYLETINNLIDKENKKYIENFEEKGWV